MQIYLIQLTDDTLNDLDNIYQHDLLIADSVVADHLLDQLEQRFDTLRLEPNRTKIYADLLSAGIYLHEFLTKHFRIVYCVDEAHKKVFAW
jgi:plasmid stabilization system protein ParE